MKNLALILIHVCCATILFTQACSKKPTDKLKGDWKTADGIKLKITADKFTEDNGNPDPVTEDYFLKDSVIYTSYQGNQPYTQFVIRKLDEHNLTLLYPDSVEVAFTR